ncbi:ATP-binding protein, partial [Candidatus Fermentibacteria bacterium]|nr:ATP-binding protein [Candidatus Fermentibacteria bacterium]
TASMPESDIPLLQIARRFNLDRNEQLILAAAVGLDADPDLMELIGRLGQPRRVTVRAVQRMLAPCGVDFTATRALFKPDAPLLSSGLLRFAVHPDTEEEALTTALLVSQDCAETVLGTSGREGQEESMRDDSTGQEPPAIKERPGFMTAGPGNIPPAVSRGRSRTHRPAGASAEVKPGNMKLAELVLPGEVMNALNQFVQNPRALDATLASWGCTEMMTPGPFSLAVFWGEKGSGRKTAAEAVAGELGIPLVCVNPMEKARGPEDSVKLVVSGLETACAVGGILMIHPADPLFSQEYEDDLCPGILEGLSRHSGRVIMVTRHAPPASHPLGAACSFPIHFPRPDRDTRERLWRRLMPPGVPVDDEIDFGRLASAFPWNAGRIHEAIRRGVRRAAGRPGSGNVLRLKDIQFDEGPGTAGASGSSIPSEIIAPSVRLDSVALPDDLLAKVHEILAAAEHRALVLEKWGFGEKYRTGHGISALFYGPSGTGKTLTAEAVAGELGLPLRVVSAANILDKWVGETEKNTTQLFRTASEAGEVLLLDEADGLFGRRVSNSSNNSYYINNHINCLLSEMDSFRGIVILSSNRAFAMDRAFDRRIRWKLRFPMPGPEAREAIWRLSLPAGAPLDPDIDYADLARRYEFSGGLIRSAVLKAAYAAAAEGCAIAMRHLVAAAETETVSRRARRAMGFAPLAE